MRVYVSDMDPATGARRVRVTTEQQSQAGLVDTLVADLRQLEQDVSDMSDPDGAHEVRRARRQQIIDRLAEFEQAPPPRLLHDRVTGAVDRFAWGERSEAAAALGAAILTLEIGEEAPDSLGAALRDDLLVRFSPTQRLELPANEVWRWINQHRELVERELFDQLPTSHPPEPSVSEHLDQLPAPRPVEPALDDSEEVGGATASALVAACEQAWTAIQTHHPDLPDAVIVLGTGVERGRLVKLGHWWGGRWVADGQTRGEVLLAGEALHLPPGEVFEILLHEAAHGLNAARGIKDTSRGGRYHNQRFKAAAEEVLLQVRALPPYGLARTLLTPDAADRYDDAIERLGDAMRIARRLDPAVRAGIDKDDGQTIEGQLGGRSDDGEERARSQAVTSVCGCGRRMRMAPSVLAAGPVFCGLCNAEFASTKDRAEPHADSSPVDRNEPASAPSTAGIEAPARPVSGNEQRDRIEAALNRLLTNDQRVDEPLPLDLPANRPDGSLAKVAELAPTADELAALAHWYQRFGQENETPMPTANAEQAVRLDRLARAVLEADGTLRGPTLHQPATGRTFQAGDRVITNAAGDDLPAGTLGTVEHVNPGDRSMRIDFATLARIDSRIDGALTRALSYDYTEPAADHDADVDGIDVDIPM